jgi:hypothetical protein
VNLGTGEVGGGRWEEEEEDLDLDEKCVQGNM